MVGGGRGALQNVSSLHEQAPRNEVEPPRLGNFAIIGYHCELINLPGEQLMKRVNRARERCHVIYCEGERFPSPRSCKGKKIEM